VASPAIVVPWRITPEREASMLTAFRHNSFTFSDIPIYKSDSLEEKFNRSQARNLGCDKAIADGHDILIVLDADTIFERSAIEEAIETVGETILHPYDRDFETSFFHKEDDIEQEKLSLERIKETRKPNYGHIGSGWVMTSEVFKHINGWDERFLDWGWEDTALNVVNKTLFGRNIEHLSGCAFRITHRGVNRGVEMANGINRKHYMENYFSITEPDELYKLIAKNR